MRYTNPRLYFTLIRGVSSSLLNVDYYGWRTDAVEWGGGISVTCTAGPNIRWCAAVEISCNFRTVKRC